MSLREAILKELAEAVRTKEEMSRSLAEGIEKAVVTIVAAFRKGGKVITFGNGGSAADAQHFAAELIGRFGKDRKALPALALTLDTPTLTAISNDYGYPSVFSRQVEALATPLDVVVAISTSGNSPNVIEGALAGKRAGATTIALSGRQGGALKDLVDLPLLVPADSPSRIQEGHITIIHVICKMVEEALFENRA